MDRDEIEEAAKRAGLAKLFAQFPEEIAAAIELACEQAAAMRALSLDWDDAP